MTDEFLASLRNDWREQPGLPEGLMDRTRRARLRGLAMLVAELAMAVCALGVGLWFALAALSTGRLIFTASAIVMLVTIPGFAIAAVWTRRGILKWEDETPSGILNARLRQIVATLRALRLGWWAIGVIAAFVAVLWTLELGGVLGERAFLELYTLVSAAALAAGAIWILLRRPRLLAERASCEQLLAELSEA